MTPAVSADYAPRTRPPTRTTIAGGTGASVRVAEGGTVHVVNTLGRQVADTWAVAAAPDGAALSMSHSRLATGHVSPRVGDVLVDGRRTPMLRLLRDTSDGRHDTLIPACDPHRYRALGARGYHRSCADNYAAALADRHVAPGGVPDPLNLFMAVSAAADGALTLRPSRAQAGSEVVFEALQDLWLVVSACPQDLVPISGEGAAPRQIDVYTA